jgi:hypothetical protein
MSQSTENSGAFPDKLTDKVTVQKSKFYTSPKSNATSNPEVVFFSEDFASGIPSTWTNQGFDDLGNAMPNAVWEYRGTATTPSNAVGSRGAYAGPQTSGNSGTPIASTTTANGFVIFDSDYLDNNGDRTTMGLGAAPAPHVGKLTTPIINLSGNSSVNLSFSTYYRTFQSNAFVVFSTDGGATWPDTINVHGDLAVNAASTNGATVSFFVGCYIGGASQARMQFIFDGTPGNANGNGYYFWQLDDVVLESGDKHSIAFTSLSGSQTAPMFDMIWETQSGRTANSGQMGLSTSAANATDQTRSVTFDCNAYSKGSESLTGVQLAVDIFYNGTLVTTRSSATNTLNSCDTISWSSLNTYSNPWTPTAAGDYDIVYTLLSDSAATAYSDTFTISVTNAPATLSSDLGRSQSSFGTNSLDDDGMIYAPEYDLVDAAILTSVRVYLATTTVAGGVIEVAIYDTTGRPDIVVDPTVPYDNNYLLGTSSAGWVSTSSDAYTVTASDLTRGYADISLTDGTNPYISLPVGGYSVALTLYSSSGATPVMILNDESFSTAGRRLMYSPSNSRWFSGFTSPVFNAPVVRMVFAPNVSIAEQDVLNNALTISPNPARDFINVEFFEIDGDFELTLMNITGQVVAKENVKVNGAAKHTLNVSNLASGVYMLNVNNGKTNVTHKISVQ